MAKIALRHNAPPHVSAAASSAAKLAVLNHQKSSSSLAAAAAGTALKQNPHPPTDVGNVQTKRLLRRDSNGSSTTGSPRPGLERRTSLTERSLRSPSPGREQAVTSPTNAPPVPALPAGVERTPSGRHRASSVEAQRRMTSPSPKQSSGRGMSLDRAGNTAASPVSALKKASPKLAQLQESEPTSLRSSVNFSRPMSPAPVSPVSATSPSSGGTGWFAGPVVSNGRARQTLDSLEPGQPALTSSQLTGIQSGLQGTADQPVKKKKKRQKASAGGNEGARLSEGTMHLTGTAVEQTRAELAAAPSSSTTSSHGRSSIDSDRSSSNIVQPDQPKTRIGQVLARQPSMIDEAPEYDQVPERANTSRKVDVVPQSKSSLVGSRVGMTTPEPTPAMRATSATTPDYGQPNGSAAQRNNSLSPSRSARFKAKPDFLGDVHHQPPGRAASPAKSALKHSPSNSVRNASPDVRFSAPSSEAGDFGPPLTKKRSTRVSFDETPVVHTELQPSKYASAEPVPANDFSNDLEDIMKPRAALPTFGSVRNKKETSPPATHLPRSKAGQAHAHVTGHANDAVVGGILAHDFTSKSTSQQARHDRNAPLAPEVTTVEGTGYASDSDSEYSEDPSHLNTLQHEKLNFSGQPETIAEGITSSYTHNSVTAEREQNDTARHLSDDSPVGGMEDSGYASTVGSTVFGSRPYTSPPVIAVQPATPAAEEPDLHIPGSFPGGWDDDVGAPPASGHAAGTTPTTGLQLQASPPVTGPVTFGTLAALRAEDQSDTESDTSSIWSDAEEDFPSGPGGFASLNAMVDSTKTPTPPGLVLSKHAPGASAQGQPPSPVAAQWDKDITYWRGLSEQKKRDLEQAALRKEQELGIESSEGETAESSDDEDDEGVRTIVKPVKQPARPSTPPKHQVRQQPKLESPIAFTTTTSAPIAAPTVKKEPKLRSSMRQSQMSSDEAPPTRMKKSMRTGNAPQQATPAAQPKTSGEHHFRSSMRGAAQPRPDPVRRHSSGLDESRYAAPTTTAVPAVQTGRSRAASSVSVPRIAPKKPAAQPAPVPTAPTLRRQTSDGSVSSFKRERVSSPGGMSMRMSMRGAPATARKAEQRPQSPPEKTDSKARGLLNRMRSLSPAAREPQPAHMRSSMRPASSSGPPPARTMRPEQPEPEPKPPKASRFKSPTRLGFGRTSKHAPESPQSPPRAAAPVVAPVEAPPRYSKYKSRLSADSDDEEVPATRFVSRFADSDDDEPSSPQVKKLAPVRGIPRKENEGDSTDLEDSDHERAGKIPPVPTLQDIDHAHGKKAAPLTNGHRKTASILSTGSLRTGKTGSEASGLNASKFANVDRIGPVPETTSVQAPSTPVERPQQKRRLSWLGMGKGSRRSESMPPPSLASPPSSPAQVKPNLLRRSTPTGLPTLTEDWPLASSAGEDARPNTADGPGTALRLGSLRNRPDVGKRRSTADYPIGHSVIGAADDEGSVVGGEKKKVGFNFESGEPVYSQRTGKKKKFGGLRKIFGLHD